MTTFLLVMLAAAVLGIGLCLGYIVGDREHMDAFKRGYERGRTDAGLILSARQERRTT